MGRNRTVGLCSEDGDQKGGGGRVEQECLEVGVGEREYI